MPHNPGRVAFFFIAIGLGPGGDFENQGAHCITDSRSRSLSLSLPLSAYSWRQLATLGATPGGG